MPNATEHFIDAFLSSALCYGLVRKFVFNEQPTLNETVAWGLAGGIAGLVPDLLEPATSPCHRKFIHSKSCLVALGYVNKKAFENPDLTPEQKTAIGTLSIGFASHLFADSTTSAGLPFI